MERIEKEREYIRDYWFKDHVATVVEHDGVTILDWRKPGTSMYAVKYVMVGNKLFISGDIGDAVYDLTWSATMESFNDVNLSYFTGKLSCSSRDRWNFNSEKACKELDEWLDERIHDLEDDRKGIQVVLDIHRDLQRAIREYDSESVYKHEVWRCYQEYDDTDAEEFEVISDFGRHLPNEFIAYLLGIQMANEQLKKTELLEVAE